MYKYYVFVVCLVITYINLNCFYFILPPSKKNKKLTKQATTTKNYAALDEAIKTKLEPFLYNNGNGKLFHVSRLALMRNKDRPKHKHIFKNEEEFDQYKEPTPEECKGNG